MTKEQRVFWRVARKHLKTLRRVCFWLVILALFCYGEWGMAHWIHVRFHETWTNATVDVCLLHVVFVLVVVPSVFALYHPVTEYFRDTHKQAEREIDAELSTEPAETLLRGSQDR